MQSKSLHSLTLSSSNGERETDVVTLVSSFNRESSADRTIFSLAPSDGERVRVRGLFYRGF
jgi:hypothetical protein